jgi:ribokinase
MAPRIVVVGSSNTDLVVTLPALPKPGETLLGGDLLTAQGGKGANQAVAAARLGAAVTLVGCVGDDDFGVASLAQYAREGMDTRRMRVVAGTPSGVALIFVGASGENMIAVASGANLRLSAADIEAAASVIQAADVLLLQLETPLTTVLSAAHLAHAAGVKVILNPAPAQPLPPSLLALVDVLTPNEREALLVSGLPADAAPAAAAAHLQSLGVKTVVVTLGAAGALVKDAAHPAFTVPSFRVPAVDTVAAGDAFNGGLAVALAQDQPLAAAVRFANAVAALAVTRPGAQSSLPSAQEVAAFLEARRGD